MKRQRKRIRKSRRKLIGVIAEDDSDVQVVSQLMQKIAKSPFILRSFAAGGCGKIIGKCRAWALNLRDQGCRYLLLFHDLDQAQLQTLKSELTSALGQPPISPHLIVVPVREIEAWLLSDHNAINKALKLRSGLSQIANPESLQSPKERLGHLIYVRSAHKRRYVNSIHNEQIAAACNPVNLRRCPSYLPFDAFVRSNI